MQKTSINFKIGVILFIVFISAISNITKINENIILNNELLTKTTEPQQSTISSDLVAAEMLETDTEYTYDYVNNKTTLDLDSNGNFKSADIVSNIESYGFTFYQRGVNNPNMADSDIYNKIDNINHAFMPFESKSGIYDIYNLSVNAKWVKESPVTSIDIFVNIWNTVLYGGVDILVDEIVDTVKITITNEVFATTTIHMCDIQLVSSLTYDNNWYFDLYTDLPDDIYLAYDNTESYESFIFDGIDKYEYTYGYAISCNIVRELDNKNNTIGGYTTSVETNAFYRMQEFKFNGSGILNSVTIKLSNPSGTPFKISLFKARYDTYYNRTIFDDIVRESGVYTGTEETWNLNQLMNYQTFNNSYFICTQVYNTIAVWKYNTSGGSDLKSYHMNIIGSAVTELPGDYYLHLNYSMFYDINECISGLLVNGTKYDDYINSYIYNGSGVKTIVLEYNITYDGFYFVVSSYDIILKLNLPYQLYIINESADYLVLYRYSAFVFSVGSNVFDVDNDLLTMSMIYVIYGGNSTFHETKVMLNGEFDDFIHLHYVETINTMENTNIYDKMTYIHQTGGITFNTGTYYIAIRTIYLLEPPYGFEYNFTNNDYSNNTSLFMPKISLLYLMFIPATIIMLLIIIKIPSKKFNIINED